MVRQETTVQLPLSGKPQRVALVLGGTGMLRPAVEQLVHEGETVVVVARHASRLAEALRDEVTGVDADWTHPENDTNRSAAAVAGREVLGVLFWVHHPYRDEIKRFIEPLLLDRTRVVRLWGNTGGNPRTKVQAAFRPGNGDVSKVYLDITAGPHRRVWLIHQQISEAALTALHGTDDEHIVGDLIDP